MCPARVQARVWGQLWQGGKLPGPDLSGGGAMPGFYYRAKTPASCASEPASLVLSTIHTFGLR
jgi:hypothetical protein